MHSVCSQGHSCAIAWEHLRSSELQIPPSDLNHYLDFKNMLSDQEARTKVRRLKFKVQIHALASMQGHYRGKFLKCV